MLAYTFLQLRDKLASTFNLRMLLIWYSTPSWNALGHGNYRKEEYRSDRSYCNKRHTRSYPLKQSRKTNCHYKFARDENWEAGKCQEETCTPQQAGPTRTPFEHSWKSKKHPRWPNRCYGRPCSRMDQDVTAQPSTRLCQRGKQSIIYRNTP